MTQTHQPPTVLAKMPMHRLGWKSHLLVLAIVGGVFLPVMGTYGMFDPWETHYTEVARQFMENDDWMRTQWHNGTGPEGYSERNFWSKPVGSFWMSGLALKILGFEDKITLRGARRSGTRIDPGEYLTTGGVEWAVRLPFFLCSLFGIFCLYLMAGRLFGAKAGVFTAVVLTTAPMYFMIGRQAMTDMAYVGPMAGAIAMFILGIFGAPEPFERFKSVSLGKLRISWPHAPAYYAFIGIFALILGLQLYAVMGSLIRIPLPFKIGSHTISAAIIMVLYVVLGLFFVFLSRNTKTKNEVYLYIFYAAVAIAGTAKGLIGALQPGLVILVYLLASREWRLLAHAALLRGLIVSICLFAPWFHGMYLRYGRSWWNELFGTEQFRRLTIGEQAQAKGTWEYYLQQVGYGLFPWIAFLPAALTRAFSVGGKSAARSAEDRARLFISLWFITTLGLFTLTLTKYHHYILPAIPPAAALVGIFLNDLWERRLSFASAAIVGSAVVFAVVAIDLIKQPAHWVWMYTYLYTLNWSRGVPEGTPILIYSALIGAAMAAMLVPKLRAAAISSALVVGLVVGGSIINWHQVKCAPHWSQKYVLKTYYKLRKGPEEELVAWQFNWRGETWYTAAQVVVSKSLDNTKITKWLSERTGKRFFFVTERSRYGSLRSMLPTAQGRKTLKIVDDSNIHYVLAAASL